MRSCYKNAPACTPVVGNASHMYGLLWCTLGRRAPTFFRVHSPPSPSVRYAFSDVFGRFRTFSRYKYICNFFFKTRQKKRKAPLEYHKHSLSSGVFGFRQICFEKSRFLCFFFLFKKINPKLILRRFACFKSQFCDTGQEVYW